MKKSDEQMYALESIFLKMIFLFTALKMTKLISLNVSNTAIKTKLGYRGVVWDCTSIENLFTKNQLGKIHCQSEYTTFKYKINELLK